MFPSEQLQDLEARIQRLSAAELAEFRNWFSQFDDDRWDEQIEQDLASGKLDSLMAEAAADFNAGKNREL